MNKLRKYSSRRNIYFFSKDGEVTSFVLDEFDRLKKNFKKLEQRKENEIYKDYFNKNTIQDHNMYFDLNTVIQNDSQQQNHKISDSNDFYIDQSDKEMHNK